MAELVARERIEEHAKAAAAQAKKGATPVNPYGAMTCAGHVWQECLDAELEGVAA